MIQKLLLLRFSLFSLLILFGCQEDPAPSIAIGAISPSVGFVGTVVTIKADNLKKGSANLRVRFNGVDAKIVKEVDGELQAEVPDEGSTGPVTLVNSTGSWAGPEFTYKDIIVVGNGQSISSGFSTVMVWKNKTVIYQTDNSKGYYASSQFLVGNDIYICGLDGSQSTQSVCYWKNGQLFTVSTEAYSFANDIAVEGSDVHIVGWVLGNPSHARYWKNGVMTDLGEGKAYSIAIENSKVFIGGSTKSPSGQMVATVWENGVPTPYSDKTSAIQEIAVSGAVIHAVGEVEDPAPIILTYWKNGLAQPLTTTLGVAYDLLVVGPDVLILGTESNGKEWLDANLWINGVPHPLTDGSYELIPGGVTVWDGNLVFSGTAVKRPNPYKVGFFAINNITYQIAGGPGTYSFVGVSVR